MAQRCQVCAHPQRADADEKLRGSHNVSALARDLGVARQVIMRHRDNHVAQPGPRLPRGNPNLLQAQSKPKAEPKDAFLTSFAASADIRQALKDAGITRHKLRTWQEHDEQFGLRFHQAEAEAIEVLEAEARVRAVAGSKMVRKVYRQGLLYEEIHEYRPSDTMLVKLLQAAKPEKYGDKLSITQTTIVKALAAEAWDAV